MITLVAETEAHSVITITNDNYDEGPTECVAWGLPNDNADNGNQPLITASVSTSFLDKTHVRSRITRHIHQDSIRLDKPYWYKVTENA